MSYGRTLVPIRERSFLNLLDLSFLLIRSHPRRLGLAACAGIVPFAVGNAWLFERDDFSTLYTLPLLYLEAPWACLPLTLVLGGLMFGQPPTAREVVGRIFRALPSLIFVHIFIRLPMTISVILLPLVSGRFWFANEVILLERASPLAAIFRCSRLSGDRSGEFFLQWIAACCFGVVFVCCFWMGTGAIISALFDSELTWERPEGTAIRSPRFQLGVWIAIAFFTVARFLIYLDQRIRSEGWELRLQIQDAARQAEKVGS